VIADHLSSAPVTSDLAAAHFGDPAAVQRDLVSVRDFVRFAVTQFERAQLFYGHGTDNAFDEAMTLVMQWLRLPFDQAAVMLDARLVEHERIALIEAIRQRCMERLPLPYIVGEAWFAGRTWEVDRHVLIPRSPIAELIESGFEPWLGGRYPERILDLCTGSGCIGIACALAFDEAEVVLSDISPEALAVARRNIARHGVGDRVTAVQSDLFGALQGERFALIVSNPPYVDARDMDELPPEFRHEPRLALAAGDDGLDLVRMILREAADHLTHDGLLVVEVGNSWEALERTFPEVPFTWIEFERGGHGVFALDRQQLVEYAAVFGA
jgi:ribosomal protein L3 glutamine methyltransferase